MAAPEVLKLSLARLKYLKRIDLIDFHEIRNYAQIRCDSPFGQMEFKMINLCGNPRNEGVANWGILHRAQFATDNNTIDVTDGNIWELVRGMTNTAASGSAQDPNRQCCAGDYDLWGVFPRRNSAVASTRSLAAHGMDRQMQIFPVHNQMYHKALKIEYNNYKLRHEIKPYRVLTQSMANIRKTAKKEIFLR